MRLSLIDLMIFVLFCFSSFVLSAGLATLGLGDPHLNQILVLPALWLVGGSYLYKSRGALPLLLPRCPQCGKRKSLYKVEFVMERLTILCGDCGGPFECWFSAPPEEYQLGLSPELISGFPQIWGRYRSLGVCAPPKDVSPAFPAEISRTLVAHPGVIDKKTLVEKLEASDVCLEFVFEALGPPTGYSPRGDFLRVHKGEDALLFVLERSDGRATNIHNLWRASKLLEWAREEKPEFAFYEVDEECIAIDI